MAKIYDITLGRYNITITKDDGTPKRPQAQKAYSPTQNGNYSSGHERDFQSEPTPQSVIPTVLVLFIKADDASTLIDSIKLKGKLYEGAENVLFVNAMKMWVGRDAQYRTSTIKTEFLRSECSDSFVKEYDYIAMRFELKREYKGYNKNEDSYERNEFFTHICKDEVKLIECSKRLSFDTSSITEAYNVY